MYGQSGMCYSATAIIDFTRHNIAPSTTILGYSSTAVSNPRPVTTGSKYDSQVRGGNSVKRNRGAPVKDSLIFSHKKHFGFTSRGMVSHYVFREKF